MEYYGYIYKTTCINKSLPIYGKFYIGKKNYTFRRKKKLTKKELNEYKGRKGRKPTHKYIETESDWATYYGSSKELLEDIEKYGKESFQVKKLKDCENKASLTYWEQYFQMKLDVLFKDTYNGNIAGKFYRNKIYK